MQGGAAGASTGNPYAAAGGAVLGGIIGFATGGPEDISDAEQRVANWDRLSNWGMKEFGQGAVEGQAKSIQDYAQGVQDFRANGPDLSGMARGSASAERVAGKLENFQPRRIDRQMRDERGIMESGYGSVVNPAMLTSNQQFDQARKAMAADPNLSSFQRARLQSEGQRGLAQTNAQLQGEAIQGGLGRLSQLAQSGDQLVQQALANAGNLYTSVAALERDLAMLPLEHQRMGLELLARQPQMFQNFLSQFKPGGEQYRAAEQGGRTGTDWGALAQQGAQAYSAYKSGGGGGSGTQGYGSGGPQGNGTFS